MRIVDSLLRNLGFKDDEELKSFKPINSLPVTKQEDFRPSQTKNLTTIKPKSFSDIEKAVDSLIMGECTIIDMGSIKFDETVRIIDFLSGSVYALRAELCRLQGDLYLLIPSSIKLNNLE
ncbi:MAG: cell division protein SepF [Clostridia bacterium]|nr:cell division protein SepF [Clostridia bacterium]